MKECAVCGAFCDDNALQCERCGSPLPIEATKAPENNDTPSTVMADKGSEQPPVKKKGNKKLAWAIAIVLLLGVLGGGGYFLYSNGTFDSLFGKHHKEVVDDEDDEDDIDDEDDMEESVRDDFDEEEMVEEDYYEEEVPEAIEEEVTEDSVMVEMPQQPTTRPTTPVSQEQPTQPVRQEQPTQPVREETPATPQIIARPTAPQQPTVTQVTVTTNIPKAMVVVDGTDVGWAPWSGELSPGLHTFALKAKNKEKLRTSDFVVNISGTSKTVPINVPDPSVFE